MPPEESRKMRRTTVCVLACLSTVFGLPACYSATITECQEFLRTGNYVQCLDAASAAIQRRSYGEEWPVLKATAETRLGRYLAAAETLDAGIARYSWSIRLRMLRHENCRILGEPDKAGRLLDEINQLVSTAPWRYTDADDLVALGKAAIIIGADPKDVLEGFFDRARKNYKSRPDGYLAAGELAIQKGDFQLAAEILRPAAEQFPDNPDVCFALATAIEQPEPRKAAALLDQTLEINPSYLPTMQRLAERQIDAEDYDKASSTIAEILKVNPWHPQANALLAVIHHLRSQPLEESMSRSRALVYSDLNPEVDYLIGMKLSRKYRFREGARYQRQALDADPLYLPAKTQLSQDLLRLGDTEAGWRLAEEARQQDKYDSTLFNLMQLKDSLDDFATRRTEHFIIRMHRSESEVYGSQVEQLLEQAWTQLTEKYGYTPPEPTVVEIFNRPDDFAVRTFGMPDVAGFLGVCFGNLITANSPASMRQSPSNWRSVLWHEFCHVITLQMTANKIPRWLSEGISVYEERQRDPRWGQSMDPPSRARVLGGRVTPVSELSSAFLNAASGQDLTFAYYESSMVVEFIVQEHGFEALTNVLRDLNRGLTINDALDRHCHGIEQLDGEFEAWLKTLAENFAKDVKFEVTAEDDASPPNLIQIAMDDPTHYTAGLSLAASCIRADKLDEAETRLKALIELYPEDGSPNGARPLLAEVYRRRNEADKQIAVLSEHLKRSADDIEAAARLLNLHTSAENWDEAVVAGELVMAIDPLRAGPLRNIHVAAVRAGRNDLALQALMGLLELEPADAPRIHFQIAQILTDTDELRARRHVLLALEQAPRYREAHKLLLRLTEKAPKADQPE